MLQAFTDKYLIAYIHDFKLGDSQLGDAASDVEQIFYFY